MGAANAGNENSASQLATTFTNYGSEDTRLDVSIAGLIESVTGFAFGGVSGSAQTQLSSTSGLTPNVTQNRSVLSWEATSEGATTVQIVNT